MWKTILEYEEDLEAIEIGTLVKLSAAYEKGKKIEEVNNRVINYLFETRFKPAVDKRKRICKQNSEKAKGHGRPKKRGDE